MENEVTASETEEQNEALYESDNSNDLITVFDEILGNHIERLLKTRLGLEELELNIFSISCIVLLATRETEIESFPHLPPPRYTEGELLDELGEMSIESDMGIADCLERMIDRGYLKVSDERFFAEKPTLDMAQLIDRIFPNMPGLNFVAYLGQMIDEVTAERKTVEAASKQFNQMLELQGVDPHETAAQKTKKKRFQHLRLGNDTPAEKPKAQVRKPIVTQGKPANIFSQIKTDNVIRTTIKDKPAKLPDYEEKPDENTVTAVPEQEPETSEIVETQAPQEVTENIPENEITEPPIQQSEEAAPLPVQEEPVTDSFEPPDDRAIEERILEFEGQLGLKCPLCSTGDIKTSETAKGKAYYHCSSGDCNFISWGKPYYFDCPKCESNFLIEVTDSNGKNFLKCPKATCSHWQKFPWDDSDQQINSSGTMPLNGEVMKKPVRKVRRKRRVVRRKR